MALRQRAAALFERKRGMNERSDLDTWGVGFPVK